MYKRLFVRGNFNFVFVSPKRITILAVNAQEVLFPSLFQVYLQ